MGLLLRVSDVCQRGVMPEGLRALRHVLHQQGPVFGPDQFDTLFNRPITKKMTVLNANNRVRALKLLVLTPS